MPLVIPDHRRVFLHVPKTGGTWVREVFNRIGVYTEERGHQHDNYEQSKELRRRFLRFTVLRNPWDWYASYWAHRCKEQWTPIWLIIDNACWSYSFPNFLSMVTTYHPGFLTKLYDSYAPELDELLPPIEVFKTRTLTKDFLTYLDNMQIPFDPSEVRELGKVNAIAHTRNLRRAVRYTSSLVERVEKSERDVIEKYGFTPS
jgi:hypothetical protein